jgi:hypothetical protein
MRKLKEGEGGHMEACLIRWSFILIEWEKGNRLRRREDE